jgi:hypothetical protein
MIQLNYYISSDPSYQFLESQPCFSSDMILNGNLFPFHTSNTITSKWADPLDSSPPFPTLDVIMFHCSAGCDVIDGDQ